MAEKQDDQALVGLADGVGGAVPRVGSAVAVQTFPESVSVSPWLWLEVSKYSPEIIHEVADEQDIPVGLVTKGIQPGFGSRAGGIRPADGRVKGDQVLPANVSIYPLVACEGSTYMPVATQEVDERHDMFVRISPPKMLAIGLSPLVGTVESAHTPPDNVSMRPW